MKQCNTCSFEVWKNFNTKITKKKKMSFEEHFLAYKSCLLMQKEWPKGQVIIKNRVKKYPKNIKNCSK